MYSIFIHVYSLLISRLPSPFGSEFEGWDNPFTEGGAISKDADLILRHNSTLINKIHLIQFLIIPLKKKNKIYLIEFLTMFDSGLAHTWLFCTKLNLFRLWKEQRLGQYGRKEAPIKEALIPSTSEASIATSAGSVQIPRKSSQQGDQEVRPPPKNGITWGPVGSAGSPKSKKKGEKFRCCSVM